MKFFHMADLHLGRKLLGEPLWKEQQYILSQVLSMADEEKPEAFFCAGIFMISPYPPQRLWDCWIGFGRNVRPWDTGVFDQRQSRRGTEAPVCRRNPEKEGIHIAGTFKGRPEHTVLSDRFGPVHIWMLPFLRPGMLRPFTEEVPENYHEAVKTALQSVKLDESERNLLLAHQFVTAGGEGPDISDSEQLSLGGIDQVDASVLKGLINVALGHIHRPQKSVM